MVMDASTAQSAVVDSMFSFLDEFARTFRLVDAADILLVSVFLYAVLLWFQQTASQGALTCVSALVFIYIVARGLDMYLTSLAFHTTFAMLLFALIVVFQEDLRRVFGRLSALRSLGFRRTSGVDPDVDELVEAVFTMARSKTGALIVMQGKESLQRHLNSGIALGGRVSTQLLLSIFDSRTPGHDGAAIVDEDRVEQFAAHLPISKNTKAIAGRGTRHSAALGLSECSDATVVVVSEERGVVSVAESGKLIDMQTAADLKRRLDKFLSIKSPNTAQPFWRRFVVEHGRLKILAVVIAVVAWFALAYDPNTVQRTFVGVPVEYRNLPNDLVLENGAPSEARVTLSGAERHFRFFEPGSLKLSLDLADTTTGRQAFPIADRNIRIPLNLTLYRVEPRTIYLRLSKKRANVGTTANDEQDG